MITPTNGRQVLVCAQDDPGLQTMGGIPLAGTIAHVHNDRMVNLAVIDAYGISKPRTSVLLIQPEDEIPSEGMYCLWPSYTIISEGSHDPCCDKSPDDLCDEDEDEDDNIPY